MWYRVFSLAFFVFFRLFFNFKVEGKEFIPRNTNCIFVSNHCSFLDPLLVMAAVPRRIYCIAARYLFKAPIVGWFLRKAGAFPDGRSSNKAVSLLSRNKDVGLFPEGKISRDGRIGKFRRGAALLAAKTGRPIVPCVVRGSYSALPFEAVWPKFIPLSVRIGKPVYILKEFSEEIDDLYLQEGMLKIRKRMENML